SAHLPHTLGRCFAADCTTHCGVHTGEPDTLTARTSETTRPARLSRARCISPANLRHPEFLTHPHIQNKHRSIDTPTSEQLPSRARRGVRHIKKVCSMKRRTQGCNKYHQISQGKCNAHKTTSNQAFLAVAFRIGRDWRHCDGRLHTCCDCPD